MSEMTEQEFLAVAKQYGKEVATEHFPELPIDEIEWEVSKRRKRSAGALRSNKATGEMKISLAWRAHKEYGWEQTCSTIRHELIHAHQFHTLPGTPDHGPHFKQLANELDTVVNCKSFTDPKYWIICNDCGEKTGRHKRSKTVKHPEKYQCSKCSGTLRSEEA